MNKFEETAIVTHDKFRDAIQDALVVFGLYTAGNRAVAVSRDLESKFLIIDRDELPTATIIQRDGKDHVEVDSSEAGTWPINSNPERNRRWGLEYLAAAEALDKYHTKRATLQRQLDGRRDDIVHEFVGPLWGYSETTDLVRRMTDRIIEIQDKK